MPSFWHETCAMGTGLDSKCAQGAISRRVLLPAAILFVANLLQPIHVLAVDGLLLDGDVGHGGGGRRAVPVLDARREPRKTTTSPALTSCFGPPHCCTQPRPGVCPTGCVCQ